MNRIITTQDIRSACLYHLLWVGSTQTAIWSPASVATMSPHSRHSSPGQAAWLGLVRPVSQLASRAPHSSVSSPSPSQGVSLLLLSNISQLNALCVDNETKFLMPDHELVIIDDNSQIKIITPVFTWGWWRCCTRCCHKPHCSVLAAAAGKLPPPGPGCHVTVVTLNLSTSHITILVWSSYRTFSDPHATSI